MALHSTPFSPLHSRLLRTILGGRFLLRLRLGSRLALVVGFGLGSFGFFAWFFLELRLL